MVEHHKNQETSNRFNVNKSSTSNDINGLRERLNIN